MKTVLALCLMALAAAFVNAGHGDLFDLAEIESVVKDQQVYDAVYACIMEDQPCPDAFKRLKESVPEVIKTNCGDCTIAQKLMFDKLLTFGIYAYPKQALSMLKRFGPLQES